MTPLSANVTSDYFKVFESKIWISKFYRDALFISLVINQFFLKKNFHYELTDLDVQCTYIKNLQ